MRRLKSIFIVLGMFFLLVYRLRRRLIARIAGLTAPRYRVKIDRHLGIPMHDGVTLAADHYSPRRSGSFPTILIRSPYGRKSSASVFGILMAFFARRFAERGYHVLLQDV